MTILEAWRFVFCQHVQFLERFEVNAWNFLSSSMIDGKLKTTIHDTKSPSEAWRTLSE